MALFLLESISSLIKIQLPILNHLFQLNNQVIHSNDNNGQAFHQDLKK